MHQHLNFSPSGKVHRRNAKASNRTTGNPAVRDYRGAAGNVSHGGTVNPSCNRKSRNGTPSPKAGRARALSRQQGMAIRNAGALFGVPRLLRVIFGSGSSLIGLISLAANCAGARSAGNPHATCDVAGAGNGATASPKRARKGKPRIQAKDEPTGYRASARPYHPVLRLRNFGSDHQFPVLQQPASSIDHLSNLPASK